MKKQQNSFTYRASVMAVRGALITMAMAPAAYAEDVTKADLTNATSTVELGLTNVSQASQKFGEYNGLQDKGPTVDAGFDLRGGSAYDSKDVTRFRLLGENLGLESRRLMAEFAQQGKFRINMGLDELRRNNGEGFQTPYEGLGSNMLVLPRAWITPAQLNVNPNATTAPIPAINTRVLDPNFVANDPVYRFNNAANATAVGAPSAIYAPTAAQTAAMQYIGAVDRGLYHDFNVHTTRKKNDVGFLYNIDTQWDVTARVRREDKNGTLLRNAVSRNTNGDASLTLPVAVDTTTDQYDLALNFRDANSHLNVAYYGSMFKDHNEDAMKWEAWQNGFRVANSTPFAENLISTGTPDNQFHQLNVTGGYNFSKDTKLAMNASYARNTQKQAFESEEALWTDNPGDNLDGKVITKSINLKLTTKPITDLAVSAQYKLNDRKNQTAVHMYAYDDAGEANTGVVNVNWAGVGPIPATLTGGNININANRPYSKKTQDVSLEADYSLGNGQTVIGAFDYQKTDRNCNGTWIQCSDAPTGKEQRLRLEWNGSLTEDLTGRAGYTRSKRTTDYNEYAWLALVPMANYISKTAATGGVTQSLYQAMIANGFNGWGPVAGFPRVAGTTTLMTTAQQQAAFGVNRAFYWLNNNVAASQTGYANVNIIYDPAGFRRYYAAERNQDRLRGGVNYQATDKLALGANLEYTKDKYPESVYGLKDEKVQMLNLEAGYAATDDVTIGGYFTYDDRSQTSMSNARGGNSNATSQGATTDTAIVPDGGCSANGVVSTTIGLRQQDLKINTCGDWGYDRKDKTNTIGLNFKSKEMAAGKLELKGDLSYSKSTEDNSTSSGTWVNNPAALVNAPTVVAAFFVPATPMPQVKAELVSLKLGAEYKLDKVSAVKMGYTYNRLKYTDWAYDDRSIIGGGLTGILPSNEVAPNYSINTVSAIYVYSFK